MYPAIPFPVMICRRLSGSNSEYVPVFANTLPAAGDCGWMLNSVPSRPRIGSARWNTAMSGRDAMYARYCTMNSGE